VCGIAHTNYEAYAIADNEDKDGAPEEYFNVRASVKLQFVLQSGVARGRSEVFLSIYGRVHRSANLSKFGPLRGPRRRDRETRRGTRRVDGVDGDNLTHGSMSTQVHDAAAVEGRTFAEVP
jgi:hypothetical protein